MAKSKLTRIEKKLSAKKKKKYKKKEDEMTLDEMKKVDVSTLGESQELFKEAIETVEASESARKDAEAKLAEAEAKIEELSKGLLEKKVEAKVSELKEAGKITPAQEESTKAFLFTLSEDKIDEFVNVLSENKPAVDLSETGEEKSEKDEEMSGKALDIDNLDATEINDVAEKLAKEHDVEFDEALDWCYDGKVDKEGKLLQ